jgi:hypothetical protein
LGKWNCQFANGDQVNRAAALAMKRGKSVDFILDIGSGTLPIEAYRPVSPDSSTTKTAIYEPDSLAALANDGALLNLGALT